MMIGLLELVAIMIGFTIMTGRAGCHEEMISAGVG